MKTLIVNILLAVLVISWSGSALAKNKTKSGSNNSQEFAEHVGILNEFTDRRRSHTLFDNTQSADHGLQVGHVNVGTGNFTFARKDLVLIDIIPLVFARVYDSSIDQSGDFGVGWRLSAAEEIVIKKGKLLYRDSSGSNITAKQVQPDTFKVSGPTDITSIEKVGNSIEINYTNGFTKIFLVNVNSTSRDSEKYQLTQVQDSFGNAIYFEYENDLVTRASTSNGAAIFVTRNDAGLITTITDSFGRSVEYAYDEKKLVAVIDLEGKQWRNLYDRAGRLEKMIDPTNQTIALITYDKKGRVTSTVVDAIARKYSYRKKGTTVEDGIGRPTIYKQNKIGVTTSVTSAKNNKTELFLDSDGRPTRIERNRKLLSTIGYRDHEGANLVTMTEYDEENGDALVRTEMTSTNGRVQEVRRWDLDSDELIYNAVYGDKGNLRSLYQNGATTHYRYNEFGQVTSISDGTRQLEFTHKLTGQITSIRSLNENVLGLAYNERGRLEEILYPDGSSTSYGYNESGLRSYMEPSYGGSATFFFDPNGSLRRSEITRSDGSKTGEDIFLDAHGRIETVEYGTGDVAKVTYDGNSNPVQIVQLMPDGEEKTIHYRYDKLSRLISVQKDDKKAITYKYARSEPDLRIQLDQMMRKANSTWHLGNHTFGSHEELIGNRTRSLLFGLLRFDQSINEFTLSPTGQDNTRMFEQMLVRYRVSNLESLTTTEGRLGFEKASNTVFLPPEYSSINCCIPLSNGRCKIFIDGYGDGRGFWRYFPAGHSVCSACVPPPPTLSISVGSPRPLGTGAPNSKTITVSSSNIAIGTSIKLTLTPKNTGGHNLHTGKIPLGSLSKSSGKLDSKGKFKTTYNASAFGGIVRVTATAGSTSTSRNIKVRVPNLQRLSHGTGYYMVGGLADGNTKHPIGWYGIATMNQGLKSIALAYKAAYYDSVRRSQPLNDRLFYNDMSLIYGGKFDLFGNWCTNCSHSEHRTGREADISSHNIPSSRFAQLQAIFLNNGRARNFINETATKRHWHVRW